MSGAGGARLLDVISEGTEFLARRDIENPRLACEMLAARLLDVPRLELYLRHDRVLTPKYADAMRRGWVRVGSGEPVQYVTGQAGFFGHSFKTDRRALIPRPETETLVRAVLEKSDILNGCPTGGFPVVIDAGTGSGCIVISLALEKPEVVYIATDISSDALELAGENARLLGVAGRVAFVRGELPDIIEPETADIIVSNPPYIPTGEIASLPVHIREHEPRQALDGGPDGLAVLEQVAGDAAIVLRQGGRIFLEIGDTQAADVAGMLECNGFSEIGVIRDMAGRDRVVSGVLSLR